WASTLLRLSHNGAERKNRKDNRQHMLHRSLLTFSQYIILRDAGVRYLSALRGGFMKRALALALLFSAVLVAQMRKPKPAFPGQTEAPPPARPSPALNVQTIATGLNGAWAMAFLPDGNFLITENPGTMHIVKSNGFVSAPLAGVPPVKAVAAQGLHDILLDPDFAQNRILYFTYFAPPKGEAPGTWPIEYFYE